MVVCTCGTCTSIWKGKTSDSLLTTPGNTDENTTGCLGSKYNNCTEILGKNWGLFSVVQQTRLDINLDTEWRFIMDSTLIKCIRTVVINIML